MREPNSVLGAAFSLSREAAIERKRIENVWHPWHVADESKIPKGRVRRSAKLGSVLGGQAARYAGTRAANVARPEETRHERLEQRHLETAMKMVGALGQMKGAAMKLGQFASFIDTEFIPEEYREIYQEQLAKLRTDAPAMPWEKVVAVLEEEFDGEPLSELFAEIEEEAFAAASIGQVHRARLLDGRRVAVKIQYPGIAEALEADLRNAGTIVRLARALAPGLDAKAIAAEIRERVLEELDYEYEAQNQRSFSRAYRDHPFIYVPDVVTRLSRRRVLVTEYVEGLGFEQIKELPHEQRSRFGEIVFRGSFGSIYHLQHFNADPHPGNYILMEDGRVAFLDFGMTKKLDREQIELEQSAIDAIVREDPEALREALHELGFVKNPSKLDAERLMEHVKAVGGWYMEDREIEISAAPGDEDHRVHARPALGVLRPDAAGVGAGRGADGPPHGDRRGRCPRPAPREAELVPDHAGVGLRRRSGDRARPGGVGVLRGPRRPAHPRAARANLI